jgi:hypothetical protein
MCFAASATHRFASAIVITANSAFVSFFILLPLTLAERIKAHHGIALLSEAERQALLCRISEALS